jgi:hypothetical protein
MMKKLFITFLFVNFINLLFANSVTLQKAKQVALNWYSERSYDIQNDFQIIEYFIEKEDTDNIYYIFNFSPPNGGFVIVSADDLIVPILGYCFNQNYELENHPPQFKAMLVNFKEQIVYAKENYLSATAEINNEWNRLKVNTDNFEKMRDIRDVLPLLDPIEWHQNWDWNEYCPADPSGPGGHVLAGCVAVAMAQVMKFWSYPSQGSGSHSYYHPDYGWLDADFGNTTYDWVNMPDNYATSNTKTLLYHCGVSVEMDYGPSGSSASTSSDVVPAITTYFNYNTGAQFLWKSSYSDPEWENIIRNELDNGRPLIYRGQGTGGHAFNLDGYQGTNYFHFNWGWSGNYNGYFYLTNLNPDIYNFTDSQGAIIGIEPGTFVGGYITENTTWTVEGMI